jgi:hypothetical protein
MRAGTSRGACLLVDGPISRPDGSPALEEAVDPREAHPPKATDTASVPALGRTGRVASAPYDRLRPPGMDRSYEQIRAGAWETDTAHRAVLC